VVDRFTRNGKTIEITKIIRCLDTFRFMPSVLDKLVSNLETLPETHKWMTGADKRKDVYPYEYVGSFDTFREKPPRKEAFYSNLNQADISEEDYQHYVKTMSQFNLRTLGDLHDRYVKKDVLLLCDVFVKFRNVCINNYGLDLTHYYTSPGLAHYASLKITQVELELLTDYDMFLMFESGIRGGICMIPGRYSKARNKYVRYSDVNDKLDATFIQYLDANNLYRWAMSQVTTYANG